MSFVPVEAQDFITDEEAAAFELKGEEFLKFFDDNHYGVLYYYEGMLLVNGNLDEFRANPLVFILANEPPCCTWIAKMFINRTAKATPK